MATVDVPMVQPCSILHPRGSEVMLKLPLFAIGSLSPALYCSVSDAACTPLKGELCSTCPAPSVIWITGCRLATPALVRSCALNACTSQRASDGTAALQSAPAAGLATLTARSKPSPMVGS